MRRRVKLDLSLLAEFSVFPGQIVVVEGNNTTGACLVAHSIFCDATLEMQRTPAAQIAVFNETEGQATDLNVCDRVQLKFRHVFHCRLSWWQTYEFRGCIWTIFNEVNDSHLFAL